MTITVRSLIRLPDHYRPIFCSKVAFLYLVQAQPFFWGTVKYKSFAFFQKLCDLCMSMRSLSPVIHALMRVRVKFGE